MTSGAIRGKPASLPTSWLLAGGYLVGPRANLKGAALSNADLTNAVVKSAIFTKANLKGATLTGISSGSVVGTPAALPASWRLVKGYLVGPRANLKNANLRSANLTNANFTATRLTGAFLTAAILTGVTSGRISGTPATLPTHWRLANGYLVGPTRELGGREPRQHRPHRR